MATEETVDKAAMMPTEIESAPRHLRVVRTYDELIDVIRERKVELGMADKVLEEVAGLADGHVGKLLADARVKVLGPMSFGAMIQGLGLMVIVAEDPVATAQVLKHHKYRRREERRVHEGVARMSDRLKRKLMRELSAIGNAARSKCVPGSRRSEIARHAVAMRYLKMTAAERSAAARHAVQARWKKTRATS
jgi:hypothetical protein